MTAMVARNTNYRNNTNGSNQSNDDGKWKSSFNGGDKGKGSWTGSGSKSGWNNNSKFYQGESSGSFKSYNPVECQICGKKGHSAVDRYQNLECTIYLS